MDAMRRSVLAHLDLEVSSPALLALIVAVADGAHDRTEELTVTQDGRPLEVTELAGRHGTRVHQVQAPAGPVTVDYRATVDGRDEPAAVDPLDLLEYLRPSRYTDSDRLLGLAATEFGGLAGRSLLDAVGQWVESRVRYLAGSSGPSDGASDTLLSGQGVCRDFAHLTVSLLRARDVPARLAAVYAPGLAPMDFHAVAEAYVDGAWYVVDATRLAPRSSLLRISTGRDAADTAFLSTYRGGVQLRSQWVSAVVDGDLPTEDRDALVQLR
jgi:transglutaminase-like putative cysteine protease